MTPMRSFLYYAHWRLRTVNLVPAVIMRTFSLFKSNFRATYLFLFMSIFVTACSSTQPISDSLAPETGSENVSAKPADKQKAGKTEKAEKTMSEEDLLFSLLRNEYLYWKGTPYRLGGNNKKGIDCSAFVQAVYKNSFNISIARTTGWQVKSGSFVYKKSLKIADLVFFKTRRAMHHVGIYIGDNQFLHASTSQGVMISSLDNVYWRSKYWQSRRIID